MDWILGAASLLGILLGAEWFTNALEHLGDRYSISEGAVGSVFAAVGTALPETMVPLVALFSGSQKLIGQQISVGAILGAPLMISTLSFGILGGYFLMMGPKGRRLRPERTGMARDLLWFQGLFGLGVMAFFVPEDDHVLRFVISCILVLGYAGYLWRTLRASSKLVAQGHGAKAEGVPFIARFLGRGIIPIWLQLMIGLLVIIGSAHGFVIAVEGLADTLGISALILSLLMVPVATELPEKVNSLLWARRGKDTLALGNLTGALVFQGSLLPALGLWLTPWQPTQEVLFASIMTLLATVWLQILNRSEGLRPELLVLNAMGYLAYFYYFIVS